MLLGFHGSGFNEFFLGFGFLGVVGLWGFAAREREREWGVWIPRWGDVARLRFGG